MKHKAILIDTSAFEVSEVEIGQDSTSDIYAALKCELFDVVTLPNGDGVYIDDEGLLNDPQRFFAIIGLTPILAGNGLIMGVDDEGASVDPKYDLNYIRDHIVWFVKGAEGAIHRVVPTPVNAPQPGFSIKEM